MPQETWTDGHPAQEQKTEPQKESTSTSAGHQNGQTTEVQVSAETDAQPASVQIEACTLKTVSFEAPSEPSVELEAGSLKAEAESQPQTNSDPKSPVVVATEQFILNEIVSSDEPQTQPLKASESPQVQEQESVPQPSEPTEPRTPANSEASESTPPSSSEESQDAAPPQVVEVSLYSETITSETPDVEEPVAVNGRSSEEPLQDAAVPVENKQPDSEETQTQLTNGQSNGEPEKVSEPEPVIQPAEKLQVLNEVVANELVAEDYKLPDVIEVKKQFEYVERTVQNGSSAPPRRGALSTSLDSQAVKAAYNDVRHDGSETQWAVFKFQGSKIVPSATGSNFAQFKSQFGEDERAFAYIRIQTGDELSRRAKFILVTWVGPSVSVLKRAKMSTDKALIKDVVLNFAVELQTENLSDINLHKFESELDRAAGAHYGTGIRS